MKQKIKIGVYETTCMLMNTVLYKTILLYPRNAAEDAGTAAWQMVIATTVFVLILFLIQLKLYNKFSGQDILDIGKNALGETGKIITGIVFIAMFLFVVPIILREFAEDIKVISLTKTPISIVILLFCIGMVVGAYLGLETLVRIHALAVPLLAATFIFILALNAPKFELSNLAPWFGPGPSVILKKSISNISNFSELIVLLLVAPFLKKKEDYGIVGRFSIILCGFFMLMVVLSYVLTYPYITSIEFFLPLYQLARAINYGRFFTRIESAFILIWASSAFLFLSSGLYFSTYIFQKAFDLKYHKPLILPFIIIIFTLSMVPENLYTTIQVQMEAFRKYAWALTFLLPLLLLVIAYLRNKRTENKESLNNEK